MLVLSLLLGALGAAGVNASGWAKVSVVATSDTTGFCAETCFYNGTFFGQDGNACPENEAVNLLFQDQDFHNVDCSSGLPNERKIKEGQAGTGKCEIVELSELTGPNAGCLLNKNLGVKGATGITQFSELEKNLQSAGQVGEQGTAEKTEPQTPGKAKPASEWSTECLKVANDKVLECLAKNPGQVKKCNNEGFGAGTSCEEGK